MGTDVLYIDGRCTAEQVLLDVQNQIRGKDIKDMAVVYRDNEGYLRSCVTELKAESLYFMGAVLQRRALNQLEDWD